MSLRIVSLVPSLTELLSSLGLDEQIVGITKFCIHPEHVYRGKPRIGGTKTVDSEKVGALSPGLIIANKEENVKEQVAALARDYEVLLTDISDLDSALSAIKDIGLRTGRQTVADALCAEISQRFSSLSTPRRRIKTLYLIWRAPYMSVGRDTFIHDMMSRCGLDNICGHLDRYPEVDLRTIEPPEVVLLSSEPFPFGEKHIEEIQTVWPKARIELADGEYFSWYGSRLLAAATYFEELMSTLDSEA